MFLLLSRLFKLIWPVREDGKMALFRFDWEVVGETFFHLYALNFMRASDHLFDFFNMLRER